MNHTDLKDRVVIVTGASSGIGRRIAERFTDAGAKVAVFSRSKEAIEDLAGEAPERMLAVAGDLTHTEDLDRLFDETSRHFGPCDILVNNAGLLHRSPLVETSREDWDRVFAVNVGGIFEAVRRALPSMIEHGRGNIVNIASISGVPGTSKFPGLTSYCASKAAVIVLTEALAAEVAAHGIRINAVSPGSVDTPMLRAAAPGVEPDMTTDEIANVVLFLASDDSRPINGQNLHVYGA